MARGRGEGSFGRTEDGRWYYRVSLGVGPDGRRVRRRVYGKTKSEAMDAASRLRRSESVGSSRDRLGDYLDRWVAGLIRAPLTIRSYRLSISKHLTPRLGHVRLSDLKAEHVRQWQRGMLADGVSPITTNGARLVLHAALSDAVTDELVVRNVVSLIRPLKVERRTRQPLSADESMRLLEAIQPSRFAPLITVALGLGLRLGELRGLTWADIDGDVLHVHQQIPTQGPIELRPLKTGASGRRSLPLPAFVAAALTRERTLQIEDRLRAGRAWSVTTPDLVFKSAHGRPIHPPEARKVLKETMAEAGLPTIHFHDLRHSTATLLLTLGVDMRTVQTILGHTSMSTTEAYAHVMPELTREAMARLDGLMGRGAR